MREKRNSYEAPKLEIIELEIRTVLCGSPILGNSTEAVTTEHFSFP